MSTLPELIRIKQLLDDSRIADIAGQVEDECQKFAENFSNDKKIAIAVGSRGISNLVLIIKTVVSFFKSRGHEVFIIPAMGSHGGATAKGQIEVLEGYGINKQSTGAEILSSMEVVELDSSGLENRVYVDKNAYECDAVIAINRVKAHTDFTSDIESGLLKMCCIGLGKQKQAVEIHQRGISGLKKLIRTTAERIIAATPVKMGLAIVENSYHETKIIKALAPADFYQEEKELLKEANRNIAQLPVEDVDILCIDWMGKNISGVGIDPNVIGYVGIRHVEPKNNVKIRTIIVDDLTEESHGNAIGVGLADMISEKLYRKINFHDTYENTITSSFLERAKIPIVRKNYTEALEIALELNGKDSDNLRLVRIKNTQELSELYVSKAVFEEIKNNSTIKTVGDFQQWEKLAPL